jgi:hypothetical protein
MRFGTNSNGFDVSDTELVSDDVDSMLALAGEVLLDHAPDPGNTRIERFARWVLENIDPTIVSNSGTILRASRGSVLLSRHGALVLADRDQKFGHWSALELRELATALLRAAHRVESYA